MRLALTAAAAVALIVSAAPAFAGDADSSVEARLARVESRLAATTAPSGRAALSAVDSYLASTSSDATLVGGGGEAGYDRGFWIRGGSFLLKAHLTIQARYEAFDWSDSAAEPSPGGDLSGWSLPRTTLRLVGEATCNIRWWVELEFGHHGSWANDPQNRTALPGYVAGAYANAGADTGGQVYEAWIEYEWCPSLVVQMGLVKTPATRQLETPPEKQQFVDVSLATAFIGTVMPGYAGRNWDYGMFVHGVLDGCKQWSYQASVTNGDGFPDRNIWDVRTDDNLAYGARLNWDLMGRMGYEEGSLRQNECEWSASLGAWIHHYADPSQDKPHVKFADRTCWGVDAAMGYGSWSLSAAYNHAAFSNSDVGFEFDGFSWMVQLGYLFCNTPWEVAVRYDSYSLDDLTGFLPGPTGTYGATEFAAAINYYLDGHNDKFTLDASFIQAQDLGNVMADTFAGYSQTGLSDAVLIRFQWQLAL